MNKNIKIKLISLPIITVFGVLLTGCTSSSPLVVNQDEKRAEDSTTYLLENVGLLRYSTTGYLEINDLRYDLNDLSQNISYENGGVDVKPIYGTDNNMIESIELTYSKEKGLPEIDLMPYDEYNTQSNREAENYLRELGEATNAEDVKSTGLVIQETGNLISDLEDSLTQALTTETGDDSHAREFRVKMNNDGTINIIGPSQGGNLNLYSPNTIIDTMEGTFYYIYNNTDNGELMKIEIFLPESPYYDIEQDKLIANWTFSEPEKITQENK
jgi:hypothetical protein